LGARLFHSTAEDETTEQSGQRALKRGKTILSPSVALSLPLEGRGLAYLRYARAMRPGGLAPGGETSSGRFDADELSTIDLGIRRSSLDGRVSLAASAFRTLWNDIQSDYLLANGLVSTRNAGKGKIMGFEASVDWTLGAGFGISAGGSVQRAHLTQAEDGIELDDRRLPIAPDITGRLAVTKALAIGEWRGLASAQANYIGSARLTFDDDLDRQMGKYAVVAANSEMARDDWTLGIRIDNLFDVKGDSFAFGNPFSIRSGPQYTPLRPRTLTLSVARNW
jgi:iron complex outermembrane receptor protein